MENLIIIGTGPNAKMAFEFVRDYSLFNVIGFAVNAQYMNESIFFGLPVYCLEDLINKKDIKFKVFISLIWNRLNKDRRDLFEYCESQGLEFASLVSPHAIISHSSSFGRNCWIHDFATIQNDTIIGDDVVIRQYVHIAASCNVGSHCFFGVSSILAGGCTVGEQSFIGLNATVFDNTIIGKKCLVGACTAVKRNMPSFSKYTTSTDNLVIKQYDEMVIENKLIFSKNIR